MNMMVQKAYEENVLDETYHARLVQNIDQVSKVANVPVPVICKSAKEICSEVELVYIKHLKRQVAEGNYGMVLEGKPKVPVNDRMMAMTGICLRNYIDARVITIQEILENLKTGTMESPTVLLVPNFFVSKKQGGHVPDWQISQLLGFLYQRQSAGQQTILYVADFDELEQDYGDSFRMHLEGNFVVVPA
jgi:hypothetical protein